VGRTGRQGKEGQAYSLLSRSLSMLAADLIKLLEVSTFASHLFSSTLW
jgi:superfamily II DNA/RNA helicase